MQELYNMINLLRQAIADKNSDEIRRIKEYCEDEIRVHVKKVGPDFKIKRDNFCESLNFSSISIVIGETGRSPWNSKIFRSFTIWFL